MFYNVSFLRQPLAVLFFLLKTHAFFCCFFWLDSKIHCGPNFQNPCLDGPIHRVFFYLLLERFLYTIQRYEWEFKYKEKRNKRSDTTTHLNKPFNTHQHKKLLTTQIRFQHTAKDLLRIQCMHRNILCLLLQRSFQW